MGITEEYQAPKASVDPDTSKTWLKRALPIVKAHKVHFLIALILSFVGLLFQVEVPQLLNDALTNSLGKVKTVPLHYYVYWILALGILGAIAGYFSRTYLFKVAYDIELTSQFDLRPSDQDVVSLLRSRAVRTAISGPIGHPVGPDVPHLRTNDPGPMLHRRRCLRFHVAHQRALGPDCDGDHALHLLDGRAHAQQPLSGLLDHPGPTRRGGDRGRRERQWCAGRQVLRRRRAATSPTGLGGRQGAVGVHQRRRPAGSASPH